jgi:hypothetical protein
MTIASKLSAMHADPTFFRPEHNHPGGRRKPPYRAWQRGVFAP